MDIKQNQLYTINYLHGDNMALGDHLYKYICGNLSNYPGNYLEIGVFNGDGFVKIASEYPNKKCYAIDPFLEDGYTSALTKAERGASINSQRTNFTNAIKNLNNVVHYDMSSSTFANVLNEPLINEMNISFVLIDGSHHYADVVNDYNLAMRLFQHNKQGLIIFDDLAVDEVNQAFEQFKKEYSTSIEQHDGIGGDAVFVKITL